MVGMRVAVMPVFYTQEIGWTDEHYAQIEGGAGSVAGVVGALVGGFLADRLGVKAIVTFAVLGVSAFCILMGVSVELRTSESFPIVFLLGTTFLISMMTVASFSLFMRLCTAAVAGTQYTLYMAISNLARVSGAAMVASLEAEGYRVIFLVMAGAIVLPLVFLFAIKDEPRELKA
jgi:PAT family beta-lactamase induction signal transducer AmpG